MVVGFTGSRHVQRSGTWSTIRYARQRILKGRIVWPDGSTSPV